MRQFATSDMFCSVQEREICVLRGFHCNDHNRIATTQKSCQPRWRNGDLMHTLHYPMVEALMP